MQVVKSVTSLLNVISLNLSEYELKYTHAKKKVCNDPVLKTSTNLMTVKLIQSGITVY